MLRVGLTGGIASGKSTVASTLRDRDCPVLEVDPLGHELLEPGQVPYDEIVREFGKEILGAGDRVDRSKLGMIVFADAEKRERLNQILHPQILKVVRQWFRMLDRPEAPEVVVVEAALIFEAGFHKELDRVVVCWCRPDQQLERLKERGFSPEEARLRIRAQMSIDEKRCLADDVIDCSGSVEETEQQAILLLERLKQLSASGRNIS